MPAQSMLRACCACGTRNNRRAAAQTGCIGVESAFRTILKSMTTQRAPSPPVDSPLAALSKAKLLARLESLPCAPGLCVEVCPAERLQLELGAHRTELEAQNQELRESRQRIEEALDRYSDLYNFAPVGYVTLDRQGCVREINLTGAAMLGCERGTVVGKPLIIWLRRESHATFLQHLSRVFSSGEPAVATVLLHDDNGQPLHISLVSGAMTQAPDARQECRTALVDITPLKRNEAELTQSRQQLQNLSAHLDQVREDERRRLAREIHDELGQKLTALRFEVAMLNSGLDKAKPDWTQTTSSLLKQIDDTIDSVRAIAADLRPAVLDLGLAAAVEWQLQELHRRTGIAYSLDIDREEISLDNNRATAIFRIVQESLTNIVRHAGASRIKLSLGMRGASLHLTVDDDGVGMDLGAPQKARSFGIAGMRERVRLMDGTMRIDSRSGQGTMLKITIPLAERRKSGQGRLTGGQAA